MNLTIKHALIILFSLLLTLSTVFVAGGPANNIEESKSVNFGYPFNFVKQDFGQLGGFGFFPRYYQFSWNDLSIHDINLFNLLLSLISVLFLVETIVVLSEVIKSKINSRNN